MNQCSHIRRSAPLALALAYTATLAAAAEKDAAQFVRSHDVLIELRSQGAHVSAKTWLSRDNTTTWTPIELARLGDETYCFDAPNDGAFDFYFVLADSDRVSDEPPTCGSPPHASVVVDTLAPIVQFRELTIGGDGDDPTAYGRLVLIENDRAAVHLFYRTAEVRAWHDAGALTLVTGRFAQPLPRSNGSIIDLCVVATDRAGNAARDERLGSWLPPKVAPAPQSQPAAMLAAAVSADAMIDEANADDDPLANIQRADGGSTDEENSAAQIARLRAAATEFSGQGRHALAAARLQDALRLAPEDAGLLSGLGKSEYELGQYDAASQHFDSILKSNPTHPAALEGSALVAATQHRYPAARDTLLQLLNQQPAVARNWLNYGDIEYRLGDTAKAQAAWEKASKQPDADVGVRAGVQRRLKMMTPPAGLQHSTATINRDSGATPQRK